MKSPEIILKFLFTDHSILLGIFQVGVNPSVPQIMLNYAYSSQERIFNLLPDFTFFSKKVVKRIKEKGKKGKMGMKIQV